MGPAADLVPDVGAGAFGGTDLAMTVQDVAGAELATVDGVVEQLLGGGDHVRLQGVPVVVAQEADADAVGVPLGGVGAHVVPATPLVHVAVSADQEVVADVGPAQGVHVVVLDALQHGVALGTGLAVGAGGVVDDGVAEVVAQAYGPFGAATTPLRLGDDIDALGHVLAADQDGEEESHFGNHDYQL